jgi:DNA-binding transcriptional LysR family regulator
MLRAERQLLGYGRNQWWTSHGGSVGAMSSPRDRIVNLLEDQVDLALRIGTLLDSGLTTTSLGTVRRVVCASPGYLAERGTPGDLRDLSAHQMRELRPVRGCERVALSGGRQRHGRSDLPAPHRQHGRSGHRRGDRGRWHNLRFVLSGGDRISGGAACLTTETL